MIHTSYFYHVLVIVWACFLPFFNIRQKIIKIADFVENDINCGKVVIDMFMFIPN